MAHEVERDLCECRLDGPQVLYVGKAVKLRNRLMAYTSADRLQPPPPWMWKYASEPHDHIIFAALWYEPAHAIAAAEGELIVLLEPLLNRTDLSFGGGWSYRPPDLVIDVCDLEPYRHHCGQLRVEEKPGVYAWFVDPSDEVYRRGRMGDEVRAAFSGRVLPEEQIRFIEKCERVKAACQARREFGPPLLKVCDDAKA